MKKFITLFLFMFIGAQASAADLTELAKYAKKPMYTSAKISPDGKHLAVRTYHEGEYVLAFMETESKKLVFTLIMGGKESVGNYHWVNNERVVVSLLTETGALGVEALTGRLFAINYDGSRREPIFSNNHNGDVSSTSKRKTFSGYGTVVDTLDGDDDNILIMVRPWLRASHQEQRAPELVRLNVYTGAQKRIIKSPGRGNRFWLDHNNEVRFAKGTVGYDDILLYYREPGGEWGDFPFDIDVNFAEDKVDVYGFSADNNKLYYTHFDDGDNGTLYSYNFKKKKSSKVFKSETAVISRMLYDRDRVPYGIKIDEDYSNYLMFTKKVPLANVHQILYKSFKGDSVDITSTTQDGSTVVVLTHGDRNPGTFYLYDTVENKAKFLFKSYEWLESKELSAMEPFRFKARDGVELLGYISLPNNTDGKNLPLVVMPHGGPRARDYWGYDSHVQTLTSNGFAVLQVNFRGSDGFGEKFMHMGDKKWGTEIQYDIIDATKWAVNSGIADANKLCIYGWSFGAYSALQSSIVEPDLYKCSIAAAGIFELEAAYDRGDIPDSAYGADYLNEAISDDEKTLRSQSPYYNLDKLKTPVLLIHGSEDDRTPIEHAEDLASRLEDMDRKVETLFVDDEYHGFRIESNRVKANKKVIDFLNQHIGG
ncbi:prolyl oligopeptidase family serine peptidase [Thalassotalea sp. Y01]|uniref:alpha/beta hydrolase family protein n=1 Tax=Thalassotalea sp. Y01 TaxID=2729613 RepID=UPI00145DF974|nr:prolyl oligopeptidase family serine peptidase [Thalassotalea sp. Y01]NMP17647.1 S9 family peptidase [Thalassotalea sp. Y01]